MAIIKVTVEKIDGYCDMPMLVGDCFFLDGSKLFIPNNKFFCMWAIQSLMPVFPILNVKDKLDDGHWTKSVKQFTCPDPKGKVIFRIDTIESMPQNAQEVTQS